MTTKPVRVARGTRIHLPVQALVAELRVVEAVADVPTAPLRMTIKPPRFTTTTPGVMRRQPR